MATVQIRKPSAEYYFIHEKQMETCDFSGQPCNETDTAIIVLVVHPNTRSGH